MKGILGIKLGMTQIFEEDGKVVPVTVVKVGPCRVVQRKTDDISLRNAAFCSRSYDTVKFCNT